MALRKSGVELQLKGLNNFLGGLKQSKDAIEAFGASAKNLSAAGTLASSLAGALGASAIPKLLTSIAALAAGVFGPQGPLVVAIIAGVGFAAKKAFDIAVTAVSKISGVIGSALRTVGNLVGTVFNTIAGVISWATEPLRYFLGGLQRIAMYAAGGLLYRAVVTTFERFLDAIRDAYDALSTFQLLRIRLQRVKAIEMFETGAVKSLAAGLTAAVKPAEQLLYTMKKIAIVTPFTTEDIANTFAFSKTMGLTDAQALKLTNTINDFVSGMGLWPETAQRIIINLEQMARAGKVTGTELRDLARGAMLPIIDIFKDMQIATDMNNESLDSFRKKVSAGQVSVDQFFKSFINVVDQKFKGAAERAAITILGVMNNLKDLVQSGFGDEMFGPLAMRVTEMVDRLIKSVLNEKTFSAFKSIGQALLKTFDMISASMSELWGGGKAGGGIGPGGKTIMERLGFSNITLEGATRAVAQFVVTVGVYLRHGLTMVTEFALGVSERLSIMSNIAKNWGQSFGEAFAWGLRLAITAIMKSIMFIGSILKWFMAPGSSPRMYPELEQDAEAVGTTYADSMTDGVTTELQKKISDIKSEISTLQQELAGWLNKIIPKKLPFNIFGGEAFTSAITGAWGQEAVNVFDDISNSVQSFYKSLVNVTIGENDVTETILRMRNVIRDAITGIMTNGQDLQQTLSQAFSSMGNISPEAKEYIKLAIQMAQANKSVADAQAEINAITERYDAILAPLERRLNEIRQKATEIDTRREISRLGLVLLDPNATRDEKERARLRIEELNLEKQIAKIEIEKEKALVTPQEKLKLAEKERDAIQKQAEYYKSIVEMQIDNNELLQQQYEMVNRLEQERQDQIDRLNEAIINAQNSLASAASDLAKSLEEVAAGFSGLFTFEGLEPPAFKPEDWFNFDDLMKDAEKSWADFEIWWNTEITGKLQPDIETFTSIMSDLWKVIDGGNRAGGNIGPYEKSRVQQIIEDLRTELANITNTWKTSGAQETFDLILDRISKLFGGAGIDPNANIIKGISDIIQDLITWFGKPETREGINSFFNTMERLRGYLWPDVESTDPDIVWGSTTRKIQEFATNNHKTIKDYFGEEGLIPNVWKWFLSYLEMGWRDLDYTMITRSLVPDTMNAIRDCIEDTLSGINLWTIGYNIFTGLCDGIQWVYDNLLKPLIDKIANGIPQWLIDKWKEKSPSKVFADIGYNAGAGLALGMANAAKNIMSAAQLLSSGVMAGGQLSAGLMYSPAMAGASNITNYNLTIPTGLPPNVVAGSFMAMATKARK